ncbi:hypothetical protein [Ligilactobacillus equi]|nr:hypothetical protein [Ligilactobacillus equi]KRL78117.1 hypothetical protein FC36_GL001167 [Ligilactobacillus equi DSM 15833 = JCM 10991]
MQNLSNEQCEVLGKEVLRALNLNPKIAELALDNKELSDFYWNQVENNLNSSGFWDCLKIAKEAVTV